MRFKTIFRNSLSPCSSIDTMRGRFISVLQCTCGTIALLVAANISRGAAPQVQAVIDRYAQSLNWELSATWDLKSHFEVDKPPSDRDVTKQDEQVSFARDG